LKSRFYKYGWNCLFALALSLGSLVAGCSAGDGESGAGGQAGTGGQTPSGDCRNQGQECGAGFQCRQNAAGNYECLPPESGTGGQAGSGGQGGTGGTARLDAGPMADAVADAVAEDMAMVAADAVAEDMAMAVADAVADAVVDAVAEDMAMVEADAAPPRPVAPCGNNCPDLDFVALSGGAFSMGGLADRDDTQPAHQVNVPDFELMRTEVTVGQYRACVNAGACDEPRTGNDYNWSANAAGLENHPINGVSWINAGQFASWVGARLPSESEWEFAARSQGQDITYPWGDAEPNCEQANFSGCAGDDGADTSRVCTHGAGNSAQGVCDLTGNVWEWVEDDYHAPYNGAPNDGSAWVDNPRGSYRVRRGGSWRLFADRVRAACRGLGDPSGASGSRGFRLARSTL
jgi:formylglycine-generating enzyme required for sulfatase activity